jgi:hypothetical protein
MLQALTKFRLMIISKAKDNDYKPLNVTLVCLMTPLTWEAICNKNHWPNKYIANDNGIMFYQLRRVGGFYSAKSGKVIVIKFVLPYKTLTYLVGGGYGI